MRVAKASAVAVLGVVVLFSSLAARSAQGVATTGDHVILVTLDGARTEEIFGGLDLPIFASTLKDGQAPEATDTYRRFWAATPEERRRKLMPFFWTLVTEHGSIAGDCARGSCVRVANRHWFSYPGYAEILLGEPHDEAIKSNDPIRNPYPTVLEAMRRQLNVAPEQIATFASWGTFNAIAEHEQGATLVNAGIEPLDGPTDEVRSINRLQREVATHWDDTRFDAFTFRLAMAHLVAARPRVLYLAFDETDDWAHDGRYDRLLDAYARTDEFLRELWTWIDSQPDFRGRTHLLITTDHGRGRTTSDWRNHGAQAPGSDSIWMAFISPRMSQRGVWHDAPPISQSQIAATIASWVGLDWNADHPNAGRAIR